MDKLTNGSRPGGVPPRPNSHVLVVDGDDAEGVRSGEMLEQAGYDVTIADLPDIGLVRRVEPDAVVLGLMYRGQASGLDFLERHAADSVTAPIPVVIRASVAELSDAQRDRLAALPHTIVAMTAPGEELLTQLHRVLASTA
jgi:CheY-like chemotaxis protein